MMTGLTLTYFMARSNFVPYSFVWEEGKTMDFSETIVVYDIKVGRYSQPNEYMKHQRSITTNFNISSALRLAIEAQ